MTTVPAKRSASLHLQRYLITGVLTLLPIWLTWIVFKFVFGLLSGASVPVIEALTHAIASSNPESLGWLQQRWLQPFVAVIATLLVIYVVGWLANRVVGQRLIGVLDALFKRIPLVQSIYGGAKQLLDVVQTKPDGAQRVVLVEFPHPGMKAVGLVTRTLRDEVSGREYAAVFVPTTPNPTSGYLEIIPLDQVTPTDWSMDQAMTFIISGGAIAPDRLSIDRAPKST